MSRLRQRADHLKQDGEITRRNWNPPADSAHYKVYRWWKQCTHKYVGTENFCHYWRVVFIWAPLRWLAVPLLCVLGMASLALLVWIVMQFTLTALAVVGVVVGWLYVLTALRLGIALGYEINEREFYEVRLPWLNDSTTTVKALVALAVAPVCVPLLVIGFVPAMLLLILKGLHDDYDLYGRFCRWLVGAHLGDSKWITWLRPWLVIPVALVVAGVMVQLIGLVLLGLVCVLSAVALLLALVMTASWFVDRRRNKQRQQAVEASKRYNDLEEAELTVWQPSRLQKFVRGIGDFLVLIWSVVLTRKWKICPRVELP